MREQTRESDTSETTSPEASGPVRPIGPRPWASKPDCSGVEQLDLDGRPVPLPTPSPEPAPTVRGQQLGLPVTVARSYRSKAWGGTVTEQPLDLDPIIEAAKQADTVRDWRG